MNIILNMSSIKKKIEIGGTIFFVCIPALLKVCILDDKMVILVQCSCVCPLYTSISDTVDQTNWIDW